MAGNDLVSWERKNESVMHIIGIIFLSFSAVSLYFDVAGACIFIRRERTLFDKRKFEKW